MMMKFSSPDPSSSSSFQRLLSSLLLALAVGSTFLVDMNVNAVRQGDEIYQNIAGGRFWAFHSNGISIVNADTCNSEYDFTTDSIGQALPSKWLDGVYMEHLENEYDDDNDNENDNENENNENDSGDEEEEQQTTHGYVMMLLSDDTSYSFNNNGDNSDQQQQEQSGGEILVMTANPDYYDDNNGPVRWRVPLLIPQNNETTDTDTDTDIEDDNDADIWRHHVYAVNKQNEFWTVGHDTLFVLHLNDLTYDNELPSMVQPHHLVHFREHDNNNDNNKKKRKNHHDGHHNGHHETTTNSNNNNDNDADGSSGNSNNHVFNIFDKGDGNGNNNNGDDVRHRRGRGRDLIITNNNIDDYDNGGGDNAIVTTTTTDFDSSSSSSSTRYLKDYHKKKGEFHGVLLVGEDHHIRPYGYISYGHDQTIHIVNMHKKEIIGQHHYASNINQHECKVDGNEEGEPIHGIAYSSVNRHLYLECTPNKKDPLGLVLEFSLIDPEKPKFVGKHNGVSGLLKEINGIVMAINRHENKLHTLYPNANGEQSNKQSSDYEVMIDGHPDMASFYYEKQTQDQDGGDDDDDDDEDGVNVDDDFNNNAILCMPLTENVNRNNMDNKGKLVCDPYGSCGSPRHGIDVQDGVCMWDGDYTETTTDTTTTDDSTGKSLFRANIDTDYDSIQNGHGNHYKNNRCDRCKDIDNFDYDGYCICTPNCGSCAPPDYDASETGVACIKFEDVLKEKTTKKKQRNVKLIKGAGAVEQTPSLVDECGYNPSGTRRSSTRGGKYHVSIAHYPTNSLQVVDMSTQEKTCQVDLPGRPDFVVYVPPQHGQIHSHHMVSKAGALNKKNGGGKVALVIVATITALGAIYWFGIRGRHKYTSTPTTQTNLSMGTDPAERRIPDIT